MKKILFGLLAHLALFAQVAMAGTIQFAVEEPEPSSTYNGVANVRGFAFSTVAMKSVKLYIDGAYFSDLPIGGRRNDVGGAYPNNPYAATSGFSAAYGYQLLSAGAHTFRVVAEDMEGATKEQSVVFNVVRFNSVNPKNWISGPDQVDLSQAWVEISGDSILVSNVYVEGKPYDTALDWRNEIQGYTFSQIDQVGETSACYELRRLLGGWTFYAQGGDGQFYPYMYFFYTLEEPTDPDMPECVAWAVDEEGDFEVMAWYDPGWGWVVYDSIDATFEWYFVFDFETSNTVAGLLYVYEDGAYTFDTPMTGSRILPSVARQARLAARSPVGPIADRGKLSLEAPAGGTVPDPNVTELIEYTKQIRAKLDAPQQ